MKKLISATILALVVISLFSISAFAATKSPPTNIGPYEGEFVGQLSGSKGSTAWLALDLTDRNHEVAGTATIGRGLMVNAGNVCGQAAIPAGAIWAAGRTTGRNPDKLFASAPVAVGGFNITVDVAGDLSADGEEMDVEITIDVPWICGRDPVVSGTLFRQG